VADIAGAISGYEFAGKDLNGPVHARNTRTVVPSRPNDSGDVRSVAIVIEWIAGTINDIQAMYTRRALNGNSID
jgi:hypothetical protein